MNVARVVSLTLSLAILWLLLSGHYEPMLLTFGAVSVALVVYLSRRMGLIDTEGQAIQLLPAAIGYWGWLAKEIGKANLDVARRVLSPRMPISPTVVDVKATQKTDVGRVTFANSITLTPGTVSLEVHEDSIKVHALSREGAEDLAGGEMDQRVTAVEERS